MTKMDNGNSLSVVLFFNNRYTREKFERFVRSADFQIASLAGMACRANAVLYALWSTVMMSMCMCLSLSMSMSMYD